MKKLIIILLFGLSPIITFAQHEHHQTEKDTTVKSKSPRTSAMGMVWSLMDKFGRLVRTKLRGLNFRRM
jgi:hypothetical protein